MSPEAATRSEGPDPMIGRVLDERYRIETALGQGGIGRVYKARHLILGRHVALKVLLAQYESVPVLQERFRREAEALAALSHPNIVTVTDFGVAEGMPYLVMELLEGEDLAALVHREMLDPKRAFNIMRQVLRALAYAHSRDLVHRDLKPHNVFVRALGDGTDHVEVLDFGLARFVGDAANRGPKLTKVGALIGTPAYMAPEQASGEAVDARADVYAAGLVLFEALSGRKPFESNDPGELLRAHLLHAPPRLAQADTGLQVSDALEALIARALAKSPADRFAGAAEMLAALDALPPDAALRLGPRPPRDQAIRSVALTQGNVAATRAATPEAVRARPPAGSASSVHLPKSKFPLLVGVGCAAGILVGALVTVGLWLSSYGGDDGPPPPPPTVDRVTPEDPSAQPPEPGAEPTSPPLAPSARPVHDPFDPPPTPQEPELLRAFQRLENHESLTPRDTAALRRLQTGTEDYRPLLLAAHGEMTRRSIHAALPDYEQVCRAAPNVRGDHRLRENLVQIACAGTRNYRDRGRALLVDTYGAEAAPYVTELLGRSTRELVDFCRNGDARRHLQSLLEALTAPPQP